MPKENLVYPKSICRNLEIFSLHLERFRHIWASEMEFEPNAICLVLASDNYDESDYIRSFDDYLEYVKTLK